MSAKRETVKIVKVAPTRLWVESDWFGNKTIKVQHEGEPEPFDFVRVGYDYRYTSNGHQRQVVDAIVALLGGATDPPTYSTPPEIDPPPTGAAS